MGPNRFSNYSFGIAEQESDQRSRKSRKSRMTTSAREVQAKVRPSENTVVSDNSGVTTRSPRVTVAVVRKLIRPSASKTKDSLSTALTMQNHSAAQSGIAFQPRPLDVGTSLPPLPL